MFSPSCEATHPATPMISLGFFSFRGLTRPRSENTFSCAFSRTEQVLKRMMSASSGSATCSMPPCSSSNTASIFSLSYSFIWQPKVRIKTFFMVCDPKPSELPRVTAADGKAVRQGARRRQGSVAGFCGKTYNQAASAARHREVWQVFRLPVIAGLVVVKRTQL